MVPVKIGHLFLVVIAAGLLCSCQTYGNKTVDDPRKYLNLREGSSTKRDVFAVFGQPHDVEYSDDNSRSLWTYYKVESSPNAWTYVPYVGMIAGGTNEDTTKAYFFFDSDQRLTRTQTNKKSDSENSWVGLARIMSQGNRNERAERVAAEMARIGKPFDKKIANRVKFVR
jgi:outer membrane protein assembly factor BamE (lipoprotein component of BamABCDE complex)